MRRRGPSRTGGRATAVAVGVALTVAACGGGDGGGATTTPAPLATSTTVDRSADQLRLNQIQSIGTHNSFHVAAPAAEHALLVAMNPDQAAQRTYTHRPLPEQLDRAHVRQIELDVYADQQGGRYAEPALRREAGLGPYVAEVPAMAEPGTKVFHEQDVDYHSVCPTLVACLTQVKTWSDANPDHVPVAIQIQFKDGPLIFPVPDQAVPETWTPEAMDGLDDEIRSVFDADQLLTPDDVRGGHATLEEAILDDGWPTLATARGKVLFLMVNGEPYRSLYLEGHDGLQGRILFTNADPGQPDASYVNVDDAVGDAARIADLVGRGYLVRTRADAPDREARTGDTDTLEAALASGAQWISTDHPAPFSAAKQYGTDYEAAIPGGGGPRCNPRTAPEGCDDAGIEP